MIYYKQIAEPKKLCIAHRKGKRNPMSGTLIDKTSHDLSLVVAANVVTCGLPSEVQEYYLANKHLIPEAILRGFVLPSLEAPIASAVVAPSALFKAKDTDLATWLAKTEEFAEKHFGVKINLRKRFAIPEVFPWKSVIPVFDPGGLTNRDAVQKALKDSGLTVWEEVDVMKYSGSEVNKEPTLHFIQNSVRPDEDTMEMSPDQLVATGKNWLGMRGYALAFGVHHLATGQYLDPETFTWFPNNRLSGGKVACGGWLPGRREVRFCWSSSGHRRGYGGSRLAIPVPLLP